MAFGIRLKAVNKRCVWSSVCIKNDSIRKLLELCQASGVLYEQIDSYFATLGVVGVEEKNTFLLALSTGWRHLPK